MPTVYDDYTVYTTQPEADAKWVPAGASKVDIINDRLDWDSERTGATDNTVYRDLGVFSDTFFKIEFKLHITQLEFDGLSWFGLSNNTSRRGIAQDFIGLMHRGDPSGTHKVTSNEADNIALLTINGDEGSATDWTVGEDLWVRIERLTATTSRISIFTNENKTIFDTDSPFNMNIASTIDTLRYFKYTNFIGDGFGSIDLGWIDNFVAFDAINIARPDGDQSVGNWEDEGGATTNLYQSIDEVTPSDSDFVRSENDPANSKYVATLSNVADPLVPGGHLLKYRFNKDDADQTIDFVIRLLQGVTVIASRTHSDVGTSFTDGEFTLTIAEAGNITDPDDLRVEFDMDVP